MTKPGPFESLRTCQTADSTQIGGLSSSGETFRSQLRVTIAEGHEKTFNSHVNLATGGKPAKSKSQVQKLCSKRSCSAIGERGSKRRQKRIRRRHRRKKEGASHGRYPGLENSFTASPDPERDAPEQ